MWFVALLPGSNDALTGAHVAHYDRLARRNIPPRRQHIDRVKEFQQLVPNGKHK
jgi:hypothetical protein